MTIQEIEPKNLSLDTHNPRFGLSEATNETQALAILVETADLKELWNSISERGFEKFEPLVATYENDKLIVLEGNRRLAAVKLLLDPDLLTKEFARTHSARKTNAGTGPRLRGGNSSWGKFWGNAGLGS